MAKIICLDAGHGINTAGKRCLKSLDKNETREWFLNDRIADLVETELLRDYDCKVVRADDTTGAKDISLANRVKTANNANADIYISIHHNAGVNGGKGGGTIIYSYKNDEDKARALRLYNKIIAQTNLVGNRVNKTAVGDFYVINKTKCPSLLCELGFMDSSTDVPIILTEEYAKKASTGIVNFLVSELNLTKKVVNVQPIVTQTVSKPSVSATTTTSTQYYPKCNKKYTSISDALKSIGVNGSYSFRKKIAEKNNIGGLGGKLYAGTSQQNTQMLNLLKAGLLIKA